jgi:hypothetical protein
MTIVENLDPKWSTKYPMKKHPATSPTPNTIIASIE